jgi:hypothetical protein
MLPKDCKLGTNKGEGLGKTSFMKGVTKFGSSKIAIFMITDGFAKDTFWVESSNITCVWLTTGYDGEMLLVGIFEKVGKGFSTKVGKTIITNTQINGTNN